MNFLSYKTSRNYVIKPADKGCTTIFWSSEDYETEALSQLDKPQNYEALQLCPRAVINELLTFPNFSKTDIKKKKIDIP